MLIAKPPPPPPPPPEAIAVRLTQIRDFVTVVECGSMRAAARRLGVAQPTITKSVRSLESELHVQLLRHAMRRASCPRPPGAHSSRAPAWRNRSCARPKKKRRKSVGPPGGSVAFGVGQCRSGTDRARGRGTISPAVPACRHPHRRRIGLPSVAAFGARWVARFRDGHAARRGNWTLRFDFARCIAASWWLRLARAIRCATHARWLNSPPANWLNTSTLNLPGGPVERLFASRGLPVPRSVIVCEYYNTVVALLAKSDMIGLMQRRALKEGKQARECLQELDHRRGHSGGHRRHLHTRQHPTDARRFGHGQSRVCRGPRAHPLTRNRRLRRSGPGSEEKGQEPSSVLGREFRATQPLPAAPELRLLLVRRPSRRRSPFGRLRRWLWRLVSRKGDALLRKCPGYSWRE